MVRFRTVHSAPETQFGFDVRHPFQGGLAFDGLGQAGCRGAGQQRAAQFGLVVHEDHAGAGADGLAGRGQAGGAAADHQDVGVDVLLVVLGAVLLRVQLAQAVEQFGLQAVHQGDGGGGEHGLGHVAREAGAILTSALDSSTPADMMPRGRSS